MTKNKDTDSTKITDENMDEQISCLKSFIGRRFDEISMEINATSQLIDMNDEVLKEKFSEIIQVLDAVSTYEKGESSSNSGYELDAVVSETEKATNDIMDAAERIDKSFENLDNWDNKKKRKNLIEHTQKDLDIIMMSCSFQDLTGQRIRKAVQNIKEAEKRLAKILEDLGMQVSNVENLSKELNITSQQEIDALFSAARKEQAKKP